MEFHRLDDNHIEVLAGDLKKGFWRVDSGIIHCEGEDPVPIEKNTRLIEVRLKRKVSNLDTLSDLPVGGIVGMTLSTLLGPVGGLASSAVGLVAGKNEFICIGCQLLDGRKFIAWMRSSLLKKWENFGEYKEKKKE